MGTERTGSTCLCMMYVLEAWGRYDTMTHIYFMSP